jgi:hypothetical protein
MESQAVLNFVNEIRDEFDLPQLDKLSPGKPADAEWDFIVASILEGAPTYMSCVAFYDTIGVHSYKRGHNTVYQTPPYVADFMRAFDRREIPELIRPIRRPLLKVARESASVAPQTVER